MQTTQVQAAGQLTGNVLLYSQPEPLNVEAHAGLKMVRSDKPYRFAAKAHVVPVHVTEFGPASLSYPIIFAGSDYQPLAVLSVRPDESLFVSEDGAFEVGAYVPAYIRRYPFVLANNPQDQQLVVCIDRAADAFKGEGEVALFETGQPSAFTQQAIQFCTDFESERQRTEGFVKMLRDLDLFESKTTTFTPTNADGSQGEVVQIAEYFAVSEEKLKAMAADKALEFRDNGALQQIYAHLTSLFGWDRLIAKTLVRALPEAANSA